MTEIYEIVTYGGGAALRALFDALAAISKGKPYQSILYIGALYAGLWAIYTGFGKNQGALLSQAYACMRLSPLVIGLVTAGHPAKAINHKDPKVQLRLVLVIVFAK